jgi:hypothetical protein
MEILVIFFVMVYKPGWDLDWNGFWEKTRNQGKLVVDLSP